MSMRASNGGAKRGQETTMAAFPEVQPEMPNSDDAYFPTRASHWISTRILQVPLFFHNSRRKSLDSRESLDDMVKI